MASGSKYFNSSVVPFRLVFIMWLVFSVQYFYHVNLGFLGIMPRSVVGLIGIFTAPIIHGNYLHLLSNTFPLLFLGVVLYFFYDRIGGKVFFNCYFYTNVLVWLFSPRLNYHIGASGLIYGLAAFLIFYGIWKREFVPLLVSIIIFLIYGSIFYGVLPSDPQISWESHLAGALVGTYTAFNLAQKRKHGQ